MVRVWLLGHLHRDGGVRAERRGPGAVARCVRPARAGADGGSAGGARADGCRRLPFHHNKSVQPIAIAESGDLAAADLEHRRLLRRAAAVLLPGRPVHQSEFRALRRRHRPCLCLRPDRRRGRGGQRARRRCISSMPSAWCRCCWSRWRSPPFSPIAHTACKAALAAILALGLAEAVLLLDDEAAYNDFKAIYAPLHTPDAKIVASVNTPRGDYALLDDFTERVDTDISNNAGMLGVEGPPRSYGLYRDGNRIAALPKQLPIQSGYAAAALDALPYQLIPHARVLLAGASGGFRTAEAAASGRRRRSACWSRSRNCCASCARVSGRCRPLDALPNVHVAGAGPLADAGRGVYDVVDLSADFLDAAETNATAFTREAIVSYLRAPGAERDRVDPGLDPRFPGLCPAHAVHRPRRAAGGRHRRSAGACHRLPVGLERPHPGLPRRLERRAHRRRPQILRRPLVRHVLVSRPGRREGARRHLQRPAGGVLRQGRGRIRRSRRRDRRRGAGGPVRPAVAVARAIQPVADHVGQTVLLRRAAAGSHRHHPETAGDPAAGRGRARWSIWRSWRRRW